MNLLPPNVFPEHCCLRDVFHESGIFAAGVARHEFLNLEDEKDTFIITRLQYPGKQTSFPLLFFACGTLLCVLSFFSRCTRAALIT